MKRVLVLIIGLLAIISMACFPETITTVSGTVNTAGNLLPSSAATFNIGSPALQWANGYFSGGVNATGGTLTNTTLTTPTIGNFTNANHTHASAAQGGQLTNPQINENVAMTVTSTNLNLVDDNDYLFKLQNRDFPLLLIINNVTAANVGSGGSYGSLNGRVIYTGVTASSSAINNGTMAGLQRGNGSYINWAKSFTLLMSIVRGNSDVQSVHRIQFKEATTATDISAGKGFGIKIVNYDLYGELYDGTTSTITTLATAMTNFGHYDIKVVWTPTVSMEYFVNGVSKLTITTNLPTGANTANVNYVASAINGVAGGVNAILYVNQIMSAVGR
jgi:hypothetical protein